MVQFRGTIDGDGGQVSRLGSKKNGLWVRANGFNIGCEVVMEHVDGKDKVTVYKTSGSNGSRIYPPITTFTTTI